MTEQRRRRYAVAGTGHRAQTYVEAILGEHADVAELVGWCEPNPARLDYYDDLVAAAGGAAPPRYFPEDLGTMVAEQRVDRVIVTGPDHTHADLVSRSLLAGADVIVEKPLTIDAAGCRTIDDAVRRSGREVVMTFNYRYSPRNSTLREVVASGAVGEVTSVHLEWALDTVHGADYFRRWHRLKHRSGGLLVHKASHHFDLVSWWLADSPTRVYARGGLRFYGDAGGGAAQAGPRPVRGTAGPGGDPWLLDLRKDERLQRLYLDAERYDNYVRDQDVFSPGITIEDNLAVLVDFERGAVLTYSLNAHAPWEGYRVTVNGTRGRAELEVVERASVEVDAAGAPAADLPADAVRPRGQRLVVQRHWERAREVPIPMGSGSHGGGDAIALSDLFRGPGEDHLGRAAGYADGVRSVAVGIAANESLRTGRPVDIADLPLAADPAGCDMLGGSVFAKERDDD
ncbi:Gfo/Idh/MocA family oxidoreductase [Georgenia sp. H159]|uniref:Gfo/Idh/MocA family protein n=1 Tax=Georgenia sp. H159 TaxID=3076115 RepID=UPI002D788544|nr:Gfo/Idh/MocA family oxidoreductase [Georgenia sp. H159]